MSEQSKPTYEHQLPLIARMLESGYVSAPKREDIEVSSVYPMKRWNIIGIKAGQKSVYFGFYSPSKQREGLETKVRE